MGGFPWSREEELFFWEVLAPQAHAGFDELSKTAKKDAKDRWGNLAKVMEKEMSSRLKGNAKLRRDYTEQGCCE